MYRFEQYERIHGTMYIEVPADQARPVVLKFRTKYGRPTTYEVQRTAWNTLKQDLANASR